MSAPITGLYAALCALLLLALALRVVALRRGSKTGIGDGGNRGLARAIRVHGNAAEYVPIALILMLVAELAHASALLLHACGVALVAARVLHAVGLSQSAGTSLGRVAGTAGTFAVIAVLAAFDISVLMR